MNCWACNSQLIWGGDHDADDYCNSEYLIVTNLSCPECKAFVLVHHGDPVRNKKIASDITHCNYEGC
jgi:hypothetical protein